MSQDWRDKTYGMLGFQVVELTRKLDTLVEFFEARDKMNAAVHTSEARWSPITELAREVRQEISNMGPVDT